MCLSMLRKGRTLSLRKSNWMHIKHENFDLKNRKKFMNNIINFSMTMLCCLVKSKLPPYLTLKCLLHLKRNKRIKLARFQVHTNTTSLHLHYKRAALHILKPKLCNAIQIKIRIFSIEPWSERNCNETAFSIL